VFRPDFDELFAQSLSRGRVVLGCYLHLCSSGNPKRRKPSGDSNGAIRIIAGSFWCAGVMDNHYLHHAGDLEISLSNLVAVSQTGFFQYRQGSG
jgi:hypothetical protein